MTDPDRPARLFSPGARQTPATLPADLVEVANRAAEQAEESVAIALERTDEFRIRSRHLHRAMLAASPSQAEAAAEAAEDCALASARAARAFKAARAACRAYKVAAARAARIWPV